MARDDHTLSVRVFLSSPGDVTDERALARCLFKDELPSDPLLRGNVSFDVVSWDDPAAPTPMDAAMTPQEAVNRFGPKPSQCDVVVIILWSKMGTHLDVRAFRKPDGASYLSGTEWEFEDALAGSEGRRPTIFVYQRTEEFKVAASDPEREEKFGQFDLLKKFLASFRNPDGSFARSVTLYATSTEFKDRLGNDLKHLLRERLPRIQTKRTPSWSGSPYPGLRPFSSNEATIFFGRSRDVDTLISRLRDPTQRFLTVVG